jgi:N-methylhydantoinase A
LVFNHYVDARYVGQSFALTVEVEEPRAALIKDAFSREHEKTYGRRSGDDPVEVVNLRLVASVPRSQFAIPDPAAEDGGSGARALYFGPRLGSLRTPSVSRSDLGERRPGPLVLDEYDSTVVVPPAWTAETDSGGNLHLRSLSD